MPFSSRMVLSRMFYALDLVSGWLRGNRCPSCAARQRTAVVSKHGGLGTVSRCAGCGLLYRPTGLQSSAVARWYYSWIYAEGGIVRDLEAADSLERVRARVAERRKDRSPVLAPLVKGLSDPTRPEICVFGCSWGYEIIALEGLGVTGYGIELGADRRQAGRDRLGLTIHGSVEEATAAGCRPSILMSSHVLEHVPSLEATLDAIHHQLAPEVQVHFTPRVDPEDDPSVRSVIGREHTLGVTEAFWRHWAGRHGLELTLKAHSPSPGEAAVETLAILRRPSGGVP